MGDDEIKQVDHQWHIGHGGDALQLEVMRAIMGGAKPTHFAKFRFHAHARTP